MSAFSFNPFTGTFDRVIRNTGGGPSADEWSRLTGSVSGGQTVVIDTVSLTDLIGIKYVIAISNETETNARLLEMNVLSLTSEVMSSVFSRLGGTIDIEVSASISGSNVEVSVKNNEVFNVNYNVLRTLFN